MYVWCVFDQECKEIPQEVLHESQLIPLQTAVCQLVQMEALLSPVQYLNTYHSPLHQLLDSGEISSSFHINIQMRDMGAFDPQKRYVIHINLLLIY